MTASNIKSIAQEFIEWNQTTNMIYRSVEMLELCVHKQFPDADTNSIKAHILDILYLYDKCYNLAYNYLNSQVISNLKDEYLNRYDNAEFYCDLLYELMTELCNMNPDYLKSYLEKLNIIMYDILLNVDVRNKINGFTLQSKSDALNLIESLIGG